MSAEDGLLSEIIETYLENLRTEIRNREKHIKPGAVELLESLRALEGYWVGLLTGNIRRGARIKLGSLGLNKYFSFGAFGDDHEDRNKLLPIALNKFRHREKIELDYKNCIVIGDTPNDVDCSKPYGAMSIAVSTGPFSYEDLLKSEADHVLRDLSHALPLIRRSE